MYPELTPNSCIQVGDSSCQIIKKLSSGSSCVTYLAQLKGGSFCVLKEFAPSWFRDFYLRDEKNNLILESDNLFVLRQHEEEKAIFNQEVAALSELNQSNNHPNIFSCLAHDKERGRILFYTQAGMTFTQWHDKYKDMISGSEQERTDYILASVILIRKLLAVLESVHRRLLHCDIKPDNLFIVAEDASPENLKSSSFSGMITLLDFGSAKSISDLKHAAEKKDITPEELEKLFTISHTPRYAHPALMAIQSHCGTSFAMQKAYAKLIDERVDWYSSARVLTYLLNAERTGKLNHLFGCCNKLDRTLEVIGRAISTALSPKRELGAKDIVDEMNTLLGQAERALKNEAGLYELYLQIKSSEQICMHHVEENLLSHITAGECEKQNLTKWYLSRKENKKPVRAIVLSPEGGAGKTSQMYYLQQQLATDKMLVALYIPLRYLEKGKGFLDYAARIYGKTDNREALVNLICSKRYSWVFLLDGVNEAERNQEKIFQDITELIQEEHVHILLSSRGDVRRIETMDFDVVSLRPLDRAFVLRETDGRCTERMVDILLNPMMLTIYRHIKHSNDSFAVYLQMPSSPYQINTAAELMHTYLKTQILKHGREKMSSTDWMRMFRTLAALAARHPYSESIESEWLTENESKAIECGAAAGVVITHDDGYTWMFAHESWHAFFCGMHLEGMVKMLLKAPPERASERSCPVE